MLADLDCKRKVTVWAFVGLGVAVVKILLVQLTPQWGDMPVDSLTYQLHSQAMRMNWMGQPVDAVAYNLNGYLAGWRDIYGPQWLPGHPIQYVGVLGTHEWIYSAFLAGWQLLGEDWKHWAMLANAAMAGTFPAATYMLSRHLGGSNRTSHLGALLIAIEPSTAINSAWLLKDTLVAFVVAVVLILICRMYRKPSWRLSVVLAVALGLLPGIRFAAFAALVPALLGLALLLFIRNCRGEAAVFGTSLLLSSVLWVVIYFAPLAPSLEKVLIPVENPIQAQVTTFQAKDTGGRAGAGGAAGQRRQGGQRLQGSDESVIKWRSFSANEPGMAVIRSVARTLMAPYPWVALSHGLTGSNHIELYMLGSAFWILSLPAIFVGMRVAVQREGLKAWVLLAFLAAITAAYVVFFGEWSTRQRTFMMPLFFAFAALGWRRLWSLLRYRTARASKCEPAGAID